MGTYCSKFVIMLGDIVSQLFDHVALALPKEHHPAASCELPSVEVMQCDMNCASCFFIILSGRSSNREESACIYM